MRICANCKLNKPLTEYHRNARSVTGYHYSCKACRSMRAKRDGRAWKLKSKYGLTLEAFDNLLERQGYVCAMCKKEPTAGWHVDHDHKCCPGEKTCGKCLRGLLCVSCNTAMGHVEKVGAKVVSQYLDSPPASW